MTRMERIKPDRVDFFVALRGSADVLSFEKGVFMGLADGLGGLGSTSRGRFDCGCGGLRRRRCGSATSSIGFSPNAGRGSVGRWRATDPSRGALDNMLGPKCISCG